MHFGNLISRDPCLSMPENVIAANPVAFHASPYGIATNFAQSWAPYEVDPATLVVTLRDDLAVGPFPSTSGQLNYACTLDDSTMIFSVHGPPTPPGPYTSRLRVLTRSGITISMSAEQQSVVVAQPEATVMRLDSTHFLRRYTKPTSSDTVIQVFSVSGGTISLVASTTWVSANVPVTRDPGEAGAPTVSIVSSLCFPFHWDGSGTLYAWGQGVPFFSGFPRINAIPFTIGGSATAPGLSWRSKDSQILQSSRHVVKAGSSECLVARQSGGASVGFYDDGSQMHYGPSSNWIVAAYAEPAGDSIYGDYMTPKVFEFPQGVPAPGTPPAIVTQSGTVVAYSSLVPLEVLCPGVTGSDVQGSHGCTRHDVALGVTSTHLGGGVYRLWAFAW